MLHTSSGLVSVDSKVRERIGTVYGKAGVALLKSDLPRR